MSKEIVTTPTTKKKTGSSILKCDCPNAYQDKIYGKNRRVVNHAPTVIGKGKTGHCTSCGKDV